MLCAPLPVPCLHCSLLGFLKSVSTSVKFPFLHFDESFVQTSCFLQDPDRQVQKLSHLTVPLAPPNCLCLLRTYYERRNIWNKKEPQAGGMSLHIFLFSLPLDKRFGDQKTVSVTHSWHPDPWWKPSSGSGQRLLSEIKQGLWLWKEQKPMLTRVWIYFPMWG